MNRIILATVIGTVAGAVIVAVLNRMFPELLFLLYGIPITIQLLILVATIVLLYMLYTVLSETDRWKQYFKVWERYKKDEFHGMICRWDWKENRIENVSFYCPLCDRRLESDTLEDDMNKEYTIFHCTSCIPTIADREFFKSKFDSWSRGKKIVSNMSGNLNQAENEIAREVEDTARKRYKLP